MWQARGYGYVFVIDSDGMQQYSTCSAGAWRAALEDLEELLYARRTPDAIRVTPHALVPGYVLERLAALPDSCRKPLGSTPLDSFDAFAATMQDYYPFFELRGVDWPARRKKLRSALSEKTNDAELFAACSEMLAGLNDGHIALRAEVDGEQRSFHATRPDTFSRMRTAFDAQSEIKTFRVFRQKWIELFKKGVEEKILGGKAKFSCQRKIVWGHVSEKVGYIFLPGMGGFARGGLKADLAALHAGFDEVLTALADTEALIVDVSLNRGGMDVISVAIASHFADKRRLGFSKYPAVAKDLRLDRYVEPHAGTRYTKKVYVVTNGVTASAAEIFTMCMRAFPHVTTVGLPTAGALSDILEKELPNGWDFGMSNEVYLDHEGKCHEGPGIPPQIPMRIFAPNKLEGLGHADAIRKIARMQRKRRR